MGREKNFLQNFRETCLWVFWKLWTPLLFDRSIVSLGYSIDWLIGGAIDWLLDWLIDWLVERLIDEWIVGLLDWLIDRSAEWLVVNDSNVFLMHRMMSFFSIFVTGFVDGPERVSQTKKSPGSQSTIKPINQSINGTVHCVRNPLTFWLFANQLRRHVSLFTCSCLCLLFFHFIIRVFFGDA